MVYSLSLTPLSLKCFIIIKASDTNAADSSDLDHFSGINYQHFLYHKTITLPFELGLNSWSYTSYLQLCMVDGEDCIPALD